MPSKEPGRREAAYWYKSGRTGSAQRSLLTEEDQDDLPLVNALRTDVKRWRDSAGRARRRRQSAFCATGGDQTRPVACSSARLRPSKPSSICASYWLAGEGRAGIRSSGSRSSSCWTRGRILGRKHGWGKWRIRRSWRTCRPGTEGSRSRVMRARWRQAAARPSSWRC